MEARDFAWAWQEGVRIFGIDTAFYRMASNDNFVLCDRQRLTRRDAQLLFDQIDAGNHFSHRVFNLNTGVHFDEIELAVFEQEFERPCAAIADVYARFRAAFADIATQFRRNAWRRGFFNHFLVATLHGTVAFRQIDSVALAVRQHLNFDVAWIFQVFFHVYHVVAESRFRFRFGHGDGLRQFSIATNHAHTAAAAAAGRFDDHRIANTFGMSAVRIHIVAQRAVRSWYGRHARFFHRGNRGHFIAHQADGIRFRADKDKAGAFNLLGKIGVLRKEAVTRVDCHRAGDFSGANDSRDVQITFYGRCRANTDRLIRQQYVF
ncbi:Uncharacterised protein [Salmonella enterica subsp. enterica serovar Bovismorbificans]|uniref:Uncharacterized protein n=1 Tax=Salmonella enterica subsp. enterica serovar Bovismorbificans TaxID=58097 RepID=A0A655DPN0_SALET|nr:Uncharacterised protein [Salmonella enterica subsp. enterica serovar Bovismorbificans]CPR74140.1 Uncharacterised protein [Salmonella enterica subsp. enterica serovar Bovismorbificans]